jgi:N-acetylmuramoyl-L-alanine amidase
MNFGWTRVALSLHNAPMTAGLIAIAALFPANPAAASAISGVDVAGNMVVVHFDGVVENASSFVLDGPRRIAIDISGAEKGSIAADPIGMVAQIRLAQFDTGTARLVLDLAEPAVIASGRFTADGRSLELALNPVAPGGFGEAARAARQHYLPPVAFRAQPPRSRYNITIPLGAPDKGLPRPRVYGPAGRPLVVIDAGHGGHDPGAISPQTGQREKDATLAIAHRIKDELLASGRVRVALTREDDRFLVLRERSAIARNIGADLFISIHADSAGSADASGATIYTLSEVASDKEAQLLASRENKADIINGVNLGGENAEISSILLDLAQRETMNASSGFAGLLKREGSGLIPFRSGYHRMAGFAVLKAPDTPSILLEVGYLTNADDVSRLYSTDGQKRIASGIRKAVEIHFARRLAVR